jgi:hypothetical protein
VIIPNYDLAKNCSHSVLMAALVIICHQTLLLFGSIAVGIYCACIHRQAKTNTCYSIFAGITTITTAIWCHLLLLGIDVELTESRTKKECNTHKFFFTTIYTGSMYIMYIAFSLSILCVIVKKICVELLCVDGPGII